MDFVEVKTDRNGDFVVEIPDDVLESVGWEEGDCVEWSLRGDALVLSRIGEGAEIVEELAY
jgi:bifunctional DNA-binding transcriptional regulator/antitoxin component of YhaV-PrlF toxin-antitoxin module